MCICVCVWLVYWSEHVFRSVQMRMYWFLWVCRFLCQPFPPTMCTGNDGTSFCVKIKSFELKLRLLGRLNWFRRPEKCSWVECVDFVAWPIYSIHCLRGKSFAFIRKQCVNLSNRHISGCRLKPAAIKPKPICNMQISRAEREGEWSHTAHSARMYRQQANKNLWFVSSNNYSLSALAIFMGSCRRRLRSLFSA